MARGPHQKLSVNVLNALPNDMLAQAPLLLQSYTVVLTFFGVLFEQAVMGMSRSPCAHCRWLEGVAEVRVIRFHQLVVPMPEARKRQKDIIRLFAIGMSISSSCKYPVLSSASGSEAVDVIAAWLRLRSYSLLRDSKWLSTGPSNVWAPNSLLRTSWTFRRPWLDSCWNLRDHVRGNRPPSNSCIFIAMSACAWFPRDA